MFPSTIQRALRRNLPDDDYHSIGGFVFGQRSVAPEPGDDVSVHNGLRFDVLEVEGAASEDRHRVRERPRHRTGDGSSPWTTSE